MDGLDSLSGVPPLEPAPTARRVANGSGSDEDDDQLGLDGGGDWSYAPPPDTRRTFEFFNPDGASFCTISSIFCSGNLGHAARVGPAAFELTVAADCEGAPCATGNRMWFYFRVTGAPRESVLSFTFLTVPNAKMYSWGWAPCVACEPARPSFARLPATAVRMVPARSLGRDPTATDRPSHIDITFEYRIDADARDHGGRAPIYYFCHSHPYSYTRLQRQLRAWFPTSHAADPIDEPIVAASPPDLLPSSLAVPPRVPESGPVQMGQILRRRELLYRSLEGRRLDLLTITAAPAVAQENRWRGASHSPARAEPDASPHFGPDGCLPVADPTGAPRPPVFPDRRIIVISARVHPGEVPASYALHGLLEFALSDKDPRAAALRENFVLLVVPMLNPDGVARGHTRADTCGTNLNRCYKAPDRARHPTVWALKELLLHAHETGRLALYIDLHAHANKKGGFFFGNAMPAAQQVENLLFAKLCSMNSPYLSFRDCVFTEANMFAMGLAGVRKDGSSRVVLYTDRGFVHSYTFECSYIAGPPLNAVAGLAAIAAEAEGKPQGAPCPRYVPATFYDMGRAMLVSLLDMHGANPLSRLPSSELRSVRAVREFLIAALHGCAVEAARKRRASQPVLVLARGDAQRAEAEAAAEATACETLTTTTGPLAVLPPTTCTDGVRSLPPAGGAVAAARSGFASGRVAPSRLSRQSATPSSSGPTPTSAPVVASVLPTQRRRGASSAAVHAGTGLPPSTLTRAHSKGSNVLAPFSRVAK